MSGIDNGERAEADKALEYLVFMAQGHDYADGMKIAESQWAVEQALEDSRTAHDTVLAQLAEAETAHKVAKRSWDRGEAEYWDSPRDHRPFDPSITDLDSDQVDRGREWLGIVTEVLTDLRAVLTEPTDEQVMDAFGEMG